MSYEVIDYYYIFLECWYGKKLCMLVYGVEACVKLTLNCISKASFFQSKICIDLRTQCQWMLYWAIMIQIELE